MEYNADLRLQNRQTWGFQIDSILFGLASAVGLSTVWRFPYLMYKNGGAVFILPYFIFTLLLGLPLCYLELLIGQCGSLAPHLTFHRMAPITTGIGVALTIICFITCVSYNVINAWIIRYLWASCTSVMPWSTCTNEWNTQDCIDDGFYYENATTPTVDEWGYTEYVHTTTGAEEYWFYYIVHSGSLWPKWDLVVCLAIAWVLIFLCFIGGVKTAGKAVYGMVLVPMILMAILLVRGATLPGAGEGLRYLFHPDASKLGDPWTWFDAATQVFFSMGLGMGIFITIGSYNRFRTFVLRDAIIFVAAVPILSICFGIVIFTFLGFTAYERAVPMSDIVTSGPSLAFIAMPDGLAKIPGGAFFPFIWFLSLLILAIGSQLGMVNVVLTAVLDQFPNFRKIALRPIINGVVCFICFIFGLIFVSGDGILRFSLFDQFVPIPWFVTAFFKIIAICWVHGFWRLSKDVCLMMGIRYRNFMTFGCSMNPIWLVLFAIVVPIIVLLTGGNSILSFHVGYRDYSYSWWAQGLFGWLLIVFGTLIWIPILAIIMLIYAITKHRGIGWMFRPTPGWPQEAPGVDTIPLRGGIILSPPPGTKQEVTVTTTEHTTLLHEQKMYPTIED